jgi:IclR family transcriptional regulator, KDG regulon repressor
VVGNEATKSGQDGRTERETSIRRGVETLLSLSSDQAIAEGGLGVTKIAELLGREKSQVSRALSTLAEYGLVDRDPDTLAYRLGWRIFAMANLAGERRLLDYAQPHLAQLVSEFGERAYLSVLQGSDTITILSHQSPRAVQAVGWVGRTTPAYCTSVGKALLLDHSRAELKLVFEGVEFVPLAPNTARGLDDFEAMITAARAQGYATADEEMEPGLVSVAAPVRDPQGRIVAALNVSAPKYRFTAGFDRLGAALVTAAAELAAALRGEQPADVAEGG